VHGTHYIKQKYNHSYYFILLLRLSVCLFIRAISQKADAAKITELDTQNIPQRDLKNHLFWGQGRLFVRYCSRGLAYSGPQG